MSFFSNNIFVWGFLAINTLHIISIMSSIYIRNMCYMSDIITISIFSVNYVFLINGEYSGAWITMWLFPICIIVLYEICFYFELTQTEIEDMILLISTIFIAILVLLFSIHILAFYYKSVLIFLLIYKLYLSVYTLKFCFLWLHLYVHLLSSTLY